MFRQGSTISSLLELQQGPSRSVLLAAPSVKRINVGVNPDSADRPQQGIKQLGIIAIFAAKCLPQWII